MFTDTAAFTRKFMAATAALLLSATCVLAAVGPVQTPVTAARIA